MKFSHFFIDRPIFAGVLSVIILIVGMVAYFNLPIAQYPEVAPPTVVVRAIYPGANSQTVADTVATPLEQEVNGVEGMLYMSSYSTNDGSMSLTVTFDIGTDLDIAQVLVQNRVNTALPRLPEEVRRLGVTVTKSSPDMMMVVHMLSPDKSLDQLYVGNYALLRVKDEISRLDGVGSVMLFGLREYAIRVWLDPEKLASRNLTASQVIGALREQNVQVSSGGLAQPPQKTDAAFQYTITTQGRFDKPEQFNDIIIQRGEEGRYTLLKDVARIELGARDYGTNSYLDDKPAVAMAIFQRPGSNALAAAEGIQAKMKELSANFPKGLEYRIVYNPTEFISESIEKVYHTIFEAVLLVVLVIIVFLQSWRAAIIPILAIPVSLIGTFAMMSAFDMSLNMLTLFGLILSVGIVVDDAIVVVENVERHIAEGKTPKEAARVSMDEVATALIATALVLCAVFVPTAFIPGMSGQFYKQFAMTIAVATVISMINSLTLSPSIAALLLRPHAHEAKKRMNPFSLFARGFNYLFDKFSHGYSSIIGGVIKVAVLALVVYGALLAVTMWVGKAVPTGFIPMQDQGYAITVISLPKGASLSRTDDVLQRAVKIINNVPGVSGVVAFAGFSGATFTNDSASAAAFIRFAPYHERHSQQTSMFGIIAEAQKRLGAIQDAFIIVVPPPPVRGIGSAGGYKMMIEDKAGVGLGALMQSAGALMGAGNQGPETTAVYTTFNMNAPQIYVDIDRVKAQMLDVPLSNIFETLQIYLGSSYVNDFNAFGRIYQVLAQADLSYRTDPEDILRLKTNTASGDSVPLGTLVSIKNVTGPDLIQRYNQFPAIAVSGDTAPGFSSGQALDKMEQLAHKIFPNGVGFEWTELALQQKEAGNAALYIFMLSIIFVFLLLAAQFESLTLPLAIILIVPMSVMSALLGVMSRGMDNNILTQIGLVVLIGLAAKNAILIVEFARQNEHKGMELFEAIVDACRTRLRPILMTSFAFILGVLPLVFSTGAGAEMRQAMGTAVFFGMIGVTFFGLFLTPVFYYVIQRIKYTLFGRPADPFPHCHDSKE
ncbi:MAG: multidrug efflux RND transporter permease subunit [Alphaproteobacteria bacterium]|nr:multidrug efflux RND transporter permease subunit [Alphaproteobacteria bacterium]